MRKEYVVIFIILVTEVLGFSLILPFLPFYAESMGASAFTVGLLLMVFSFFQFLSSPIMGRLSDHYGRKPLLIFSQFSTFISFLVLGYADALWMLFLSRIIDGVLGSNFTIAQAYLSDLSSKEDRSKAFGISGAAFGVGFLIGPGIGGYLSQFGYSIPAYIAAGVSFITILLTAFVLKETVQRPKELKFTEKLFHFNDYTKYFSRPDLRLKLTAFFAYVLTHATYVSGFALYAERQLGFDATHVGYLLTYVGAISVVLRGVLLSRLIDRFGERILQYVGMAGVLSGMLLLPFADVPLFIAAMTLFAVGTGISRPVLTGNISRNVTDKEQGRVLGVTSSLASLSQIFGPLIGGFAIQYFFPGSLGLIAACFTALGIVLIYKDDRKRKDIKGEHSI